MNKALVTLGILLWCAAAHAEESLVAFTAADEQRVRKKIESNWNFAPVLESACSQAIILRVHLEAGGTVEDVKLLDPMPLPEACQQAADTAKRAVWQSSPLPVPEGLVMLQMNFDPTKIH